MPGVGQQTRSAFLVQSQVDRADCELRPAQPDNNLDKVLQNYGLQGLEFREPLSANQLEQLTGQFPGSKLETWGNRVTIAERDLVLGATSAELVRQLANWKHATEGYIVGGGDTAFTMFVHNRLLAASKADSYAAGKREWQRALLVPDAWLMRRSYYREVCKGGVPQLEGCRDALLVECSRLTDSYGIGRGLGVTSPFDKVDDWMRAGAGFALLIDPYAEEYYVYDRKTWVEGRKESPRSLCNTEMLAPEPDLFPGLMISTNDILAVVRTAN